MAARRDTKLYVSFNIPSQKHAIKHVQSFFFFESFVHVKYIPVYIYAELRLNWTLKGECQFHVKSLFLSLFSSLECVRLIIFSSDQTKGSYSLTFYDKFVNLGTTLYVLHMKLNLKVNGNLSYVNAKSQEKGEGRTLLYNIEDIDTYIDIRICLFTQKIDLRKAHIAYQQKVSSLEIRRLKQCSETMITIYKWILTSNLQNHR